MAVTIGCVIAVAVSVVRISAELGRPPSRAELTQATATELARRWRQRPAGQILPAMLTYRPEIGGTQTATRVGIDPHTRCADGLDAALVADARKNRCVALARATYLDGLQGLLVTVGVLVFPDEPAAAAFEARLPTHDVAEPGLRAAAFPGSVAARFTDAARQTMAERRSGPYIVLTTTGYADGRPRVRGARQPDLTLMPPQLADAVLGPLSRPARPDCGSKNPAVRKEWSC